MTEGEAATATTTPEGETQSLEDIEQLVAESEEQGYFGETPDYDRDAYTLQTGPESPSSLEGTLEARRLEAEAQLDEFNERAQARVASAKTRAGDARSKAKERAGEARTKAQERRSTRQSSKES